MLMRALARSGEVDQVVGLFAGLRSSASSVGAAPGVLCYNTLLNALAEAGRVGEVDAALDEMEAAGVPLNVSTLNIIVKLHAWRLAQFEAAYRMVLWLHHGAVPGREARRGVRRARLDAGGRVPPYGAHLHSHCTGVLLRG
jgi:pentatricopeptide repeat protein